MDFNKKKKRRTKSVQDMYGIGVETGSSQKSGGGVRTMSYSNYTYKGGDVAPEGGLLLMAFGGLLTVAIITSCVFYMFDIKKEPFTYPTGIITINGVLSDVYEASTLAASSLTDPMDANTTAVDAAAADAMVAGDSSATTAPTSLTGTTSTYPEATSHAELLTQIDNALSLGDKAFITNKLLCKDESGNFTGYSVEVIDAFVAYMSGNTNKRSEFITLVSDEATYSTVTQGIYYLSLPKVVITAEIGYADTTVSLTGFPDAVVDGTTPLVIGPLLPMEYTFTISNEIWPNPQSSPIQVDMKSTNIPVRVQQAQ